MYNAQTLNVTAFLHFINENKIALTAADTEIELHHEVAPEIFLLQPVPLCARSIIKACTG
jgi:hypothetical protein